MTITIGRMQQTSPSTYTYINMFIPMSNGRRKIGAAKLDNNNPTDREIIEKIQQDPSNIKKLFDQVEFEIGISDPNRKSKLKWD